MTNNINDSKDKGNSNHPETPLSLPTAAPKIIQQIVINLHVGGRVTGNIPTDIETTMYMLGEFFKRIGSALTYTPSDSVSIYLEKENKE